MFYSSENCIKIKRIMNFQRFVLNTQGTHKMVCNTKKWVRIKIFLSMCMENFLVWNSENTKLISDFVSSDQFSRENTEKYKLLSFHLYAVQCWE
jgi:hypothetical protein